MIKAIDLILDPRTNITRDYLDNIKDLYEKAKDSLDQEELGNILDSLTPVLIFNEISEIIMNVYEMGKKIEEEKANRKKQMILSIVLTFIGLGAGFLGSEIAVALDIGISIAQLVGDWIINGSVDVTDAVFLEISAFSGIFSAVRCNIRFSEIAKA